MIRRVDIATGETTTVAGTARTRGFREGVGTSAQFDYPRIAIAPSGGFALVAVRALLPAQPHT